MRETAGRKLAAVQPPELKGELHVEQGHERLAQTAAG
jgi:hypothetical protein